MRAMNADAKALHALSATEIASRLAAREISSREVVDALLARIDAKDGAIHAMTEVFRDEARKDADRADAERARGEARGPLHGVPITVKECFDFAGRASTIGVPARAGHRASADAAMVTLLREAGAIVVGRTNLSQFMLFAESRNPIFGQTANPWSLAHAPGGSSGGEGAAIAAGMSPLGVGTDIGGSIRGPAHFCGIAGFKPTLDRLPARGCQSGMPGQEAVRAQSGPLARVVGDLDLFFRAIDPLRASALDPRVPPLPYAPMSETDVSKLKIGVYTHDGFVTPSAACVRAVERSADALRAAGATVVPFEPPGMADAIFTYFAAFASGAAATLDAINEGGPVDPSLVGLKRVAGLPAFVRHALAAVLDRKGDPVVARLLRTIGVRPVPDLWRFTYEIRAYRGAMLDAWDAAGLDLVLCPAYATPALPHGDSKDFALASSFDILWNIVQLPAGVVPVSRVRADETTRAASPSRVERHAAGVDAKSAGMPVGAQIVGRPWADGVVLAAMAAIEASVRADAGFPATPVD